MIGKRVVCVRSAHIVGLEATELAVEATCAWHGAAEVPLVFEGAQRELEQIVVARLSESVAAAGFCWGGWQVHVRVTPAIVRQDLEWCELALAVALLAATGQVEAERLDGELLVGSVRESGEVSCPRGLVVVAELCRRRALTLVTGPGAQIPRVSWVAQRTLHTLSELRLPAHAIARVGQAGATSVCRPSRAPVDPASLVPAPLRRAVLVAAAGVHDLALIGEVSLTRASCELLRAILVPLTARERMVATRIWSVAGCGIAELSAGRRPLRRPNAAAALSTMIGGGTPPVPGEVSLAHGGLLVLEAPRDFRQAVLQAVRLAHIKRAVEVRRAGTDCVFPASFVLALTAPADDVSALRSCCTSFVDLWADERDSRDVDVEPTAPQMASHVAEALSFRAWRRRREQSGESGTYVLETDAERALADARRLLGERFGGEARVLRVARTIADLACERQIGLAHVEEAATLCTVPDTSLTQSMEVRHG